MKFSAAHSGLPILVVSLGLVACGGGDAVTTPPETPAAAANKPAPKHHGPDGQKPIVHLATPDGRVGLTLDRSGAKPKMMRDGSKDIVELTMEEDRHAGSLRGTYFVTPSGSRALHLSTHGHYTLYEGRDELPLRADRDAAALGAATVAGEPKKEKALWELAAAALTPIAVRTKMASMKPEDASRLAKIEEAIKGASKEMFVRYVVKGTEGSAASLQPTPNNFGGTAYGGVGRRSDEKWDAAKAKGLKKFGGEARGFSHPESKGNHIQVVTLDGYPAPLASGTPGLVWEVDETQATFVTLDGARYVVSLNQKDIVLEPGAGTDDKWPAPVQHALMDISDATALVKVGELPKKVEEELFAQDDEWNKCAQKVWGGVQRAMDTGKFTEADRKDTVKKAEKTCAAAVQKQEKSFLTLVEARAKARQALFETAKARVREVAKK